jgi:hypothetical protein
MPGIVRDFMNGFLRHSATRRHVIHADRRVRDRLTEKQIDKMVADSFPASDPPSTY